MNDETREPSLRGTGSSMELDAITAHFDRGWDHLHGGDPAAARVSAEHILQLDPEAPEGHALLGAIAASAGDHEEALARFGRALEADPDYLDALLYAADVAVHMAGDAEYGLRLCAEAEEVLGGEGPEMVEVQMLRAEAYLASGSFDDARRSVAALPPPPYPEPSFTLRAGRLMLEVERFKPAIELLEQVLEHEEMRVEAHYLLAIALETEGRSPEAQKHFLAADQLNRQQAAPEWSLPPAAFEALVRQVLDHMPDSLGKRLRESLLHVLDHPSLELVVEGLDPRSPAYLAGTPAELGEPARRRPKTRRKAVAHLKGIFVYRRNIESAAPAADQLESEIYRALVHEGAYFFGLDDEEYAGLLEDAP